MATSSSVRPDKNINVEQKSNLAQNISGPQESSCSVIETQAEDQICRIFNLFCILAELKINYVLVEYEDKFSFDFCGDIPVVSAFSKTQLREFDRAARKNFVEVIPLVQCIGHFEYILKHDKYAGLRENPRMFNRGQGGGESREILHIARPAHAGRIIFLT